MAKTKEIARSETTSSYGLLDWLPRPGWFTAFEQAFEATPMRIEERVEGDEFIVRAAMPGIDPDKDVEINVSEGMLQIRAERSEEKKNATGETRHSEPTTATSRGSSRYRPA
jgi:HSP20 family molecular chaperone IbpA